LVRGGIGNTSDEGEGEEDATGDEDEEEESGTKAGAEWPDLSSGGNMVDL
jgi:hypothetical protein